jgi:hypothetical protein
MFTSDSQLVLQQLVVDEPSIGQELCRGPLQCLCVLVLPSQARLLPLCTYVVFVGHVASS